MRVRKLIPMLVATALLLLGIGAVGAIAHDDPPATSPEACTVVAPDDSEGHAADAVGDAATDVSDEADDLEDDDEEGDAQDEDDQDGELGDCDDEDEDDESDDD